MEEVSKTEQEVRNSILRRYVSRVEEGRFEKCVLSRKPKVCFPTETAARLCRAALDACFPLGERYVYPCRKGHWHITSTPEFGAR